MLRRVFRAFRWWFLAVCVPCLGSAGENWFTRVWQTDDGLPNNHVTAIAQTKSGDLWIATRARAAKFDGSAFAPADGSTDHETPPNWFHAVTTTGQVWVVRGSAVGPLKGAEFTPILSRHNPRIAPALDGGIWVASGASLAYLTSAGKIKECGEFQTDGPQPQATALLQDHSGAVWIGTATNGLFRYDGESFQRIETSYAYILCLAEDRDHNIWAGTDGGGLDRISRRYLSLETFANGLAEAGIQSICEDVRGTIWGVTQNRWLVTRRDGVWQRVTDPELGTIDAPLCVAADRAGAIWIGTARRSLCRWQDHRLTQWGPQDGITSFSIHSLLPASNGDVWIGVYNAHAVLRLHDKKVEPLHLPPEAGAVHALCEDRAGNIWIGAERGVWRYSGSGAVVAVRGPGGRSIGAKTLVATPDGAVWAGCAGAGLVRYVNGAAASLGADQGLVDTYISQMVDDGRGWLWVGSADHGIFKVRFERLARALNDRSFRLRPIVYGRNEGLSKLEAYGAHSPDAIGPSAIRTRDGRIWIPMRTGIAVVDPDQLHEPVGPPPARVTRIAVDGHPVASPPLVNPSHRRIEFGFSVLNLSMPDNAHARYRLDGIDAGWTDAGTQRSATYSRLAPGKYRFHLESSNFDGPWAEARPPIEIRVLPFYWQTWWFRCGVLGLFTAAVAGIAHRIATIRLRAQHRLLEQEAALDRERTRIARDLHDDLGGSLTQVAYMLDLVEQEAVGAAQTKVGRCATLVRGVTKSVDEIIWAINPRNDTLPFLIDYLSESVVEYLHAANIECSVDLPEKIAERPVTPEARHHLLLAIKECVTNITRHAHATEVAFRVTTDASAIGVIVEDNGTGLGAVPDNATADGLRNMRQRMEEIGGTFTIERRPGGGTRATFRYPWPCP